MKKITAAILAAAMLTGCSSNNKSEISSGISPEATSETFSLSTEESTLEITSDENVSSEINDSRQSRSNDDYNKRKTIFFSDSGCYYYTYEGGRDSASYVLSFDNGDGNPVSVENGEDCIWYFNIGDILYGTKWTVNGISFCKCENNIVSSIFEYPQSYLRMQCFTDSYIYYAVSDEKTTGIYRVDYNGENPEFVFAPDDSDYALNFTVYGNKIYYDANQYHKLGVYDIETGINTDIPQGGVGRIYNGYMYYNDNNDLYRMNLSDYSTELVCEKVLNYDFIGNDIVYSPYGENEMDGSLFILENGESRKIFSAQELLEQDYYYIIDQLHYENGHIFIDISSGPYYSYIAELDTDGNLIKNYYENNNLATSKNLFG